MKNLIELTDNELENTNGGNICSFAYDFGYFIRTAFTTGMGQDVTAFTIAHTQYLINCECD
jgi:hypothetical protein